MNRAGFHTLGNWAEVGSEMAVILATDPLGRVMLQLRDDFESVAMAGHWGLFGGHLDSGEALADAVAREFGEETGLDFPLNAFEPYVRLVSSNGHRHYVYRLTVPVSAAQVSLQEGAGFAFVHSGQLDSLKILPAARVVLDHFFATIGKAN